MMVRDQLSFRRMWSLASKRLMILLIFDSTIAILYSVYDLKFLALNGLPLAPLGSAITIFLAFRTNAAYGRWWEARQLWGGLVNTSRTLSRQFLTMLHAKEEIEEGDEEYSPLSRLLVLHQIAFVHSLRCHLRRQSPFPELIGVLGAESTDDLRTYRNVPAAINLKLGRLLKQAYRQGMIDSYRWTAIDRNLTELSNIQGACERIKNTPLPRQFDYLPRLLVNAFCWLVPFGLVGDLGLMTPVASVLISFTFIAADMVGREIEDPFENTIHDTPMTSLSRVIEMNLREHMELPSTLREVQPVDGFIH
jgi:putative membrane protein